MVVVVCEKRKILADAPPTSHPRIMEAADAHFESMKPLFHEVSVAVVDLTAQPKSREGSPIAELVTDTRSVFSTASTTYL
jgi:hypothetical protein